jgi:hypothetical protein
METSSKLAGSPKVVPCDDRETRAHTCAWWHDSGGRRESWSQLVMGALSILCSQQAGAPPSRSIVVYIDLSRRAALQCGVTVCSNTERIVRL